MGKLAELLVDLHNTTRGWINRGNTPKEIREQLRAHNPNVKVGRNDACPCRSGKKYKKCCGK
ncbi:MAG: SEC-C domain-containing protein [Cellulosilyticum sp.]|nr:SEC-C domain-containing protein [Cellulosilyticum sp.]